MHEGERAAMRAFLTAETTRRFGAGRTVALGRDIAALAADLARWVEAAIGFTGAPVL